jgi:pSer/pThr/pTyr-binding forkhead associated (FHA) protein
MGTTSGVRRLKFEVYRGERWLFSRALSQDVITIGCHPTCDLVLDDRAVSQLHARIERGEDGGDFAISDDAAAVVLNGARVKKGAVRFGDTLGIGEFQIRLRPDEPRRADWASPI